MKFFAAFVCLFAVACAYQAEWTVNSVSEAIQNPTTSDAMLPYLNEALDEMMANLILGDSVNPTVTITTGSMDLTLWTVSELSEALQDPSTDPALVPYLELALNQAMASIFSGNVVTSIVVATPAGLLEVGTIVPEVAPVGVLAPVASAKPLVVITIKVNSQGIITEPATIVRPEPVAVFPEVVIPEPVVLPEPVLPEVVIPEAVVLPEPVLPEVVVVPEPVVLPEPVLPEVVIPEAVVLPEPVLPEVVVVPEPVVLPEPVLPEVVIPEAVVLPEPVLPEVVVVPEPVVLPAPVLPEVVIPEPVVLPEPALPEVAVNPIDVIAINPVV